MEKNKNKIKSFLRKIKSLVFMENNEEKDLPLYEIKFEDAEYDFVYNMGIVSEPAVEQNFLKFNKDGEKSFRLNFSVDVKENDKRIITGIALIPGQEIIRRTETGDYYNVMYSVDTIEKYAYNFIMGNKKDNITEEHLYSTNGAKLVESYLSKEDGELGFEDAVKGTWFISYKVDSDELWEKILNNEYNGFSIEIQFTKMDLIEKQKNNKIEMDKEIKNEDLEKEIVENKDEETIIVEEQEIIVEEQVEEEVVEETPEEETEEDFDVKEAIMNLTETLADVISRIEKLEGGEETEEEELPEEEMAKTEELEKVIKELQSKIEKFEDETPAVEPKLNYNETETGKELTAFDKWNRNRNRNK